MKKVVWVSSWDRRCGIADYSKALFNSVSSSLQAEGDKLVLASLDEFRNSFELLSFIHSEKPTLVHFQHEYGLFGGKNPPYYWFPELVDGLKRDFRNIKLTATAHTVLDPQYSFPTKHTGVQAPIRFLANSLLLPSLQKIWGERTWGLLDGVVCHSRHQVESLLASGNVRVEVLPHFVFNEQTHPNSKEKWEIGEKVLNSQRPFTLIFGFISSDKGQDLAVEAMVQLKAKGEAVPLLVLAGGTRRKEDETYLQHIQKRIEEAGLQNDVVITGYVPLSWFDVLFQKAKLVIAPFRTTSGSGSLAQAFARSAPVLTSTLPLNAELTERVPGVLEFFTQGDAESLANQWMKLLKDDSRLKQLSEQSRLYARKYSISETGKNLAHWMKSFF